MIDGRPSRVLPNASCEGRTGNAELCFQFSPATCSLAGTFPVRTCAVTLRVSTSGKCKVGWIYVCTLSSYT